MRFTLKEYQSKAVTSVLERLVRSGEDWHKHGDRSAFALSAITGSGKTVIAATVIEAMLHGSDEFDIEPDPSAVFLWVSKDPSLNEQTRGRFIECADRIPVGDMVLLDKNFAEDSLQTSTLYFVNPAKLRKKADFVKHTESRSVTFWEILDNTIKDPDKTLYVVLDEAHEGMEASSKDDQTIVQKVINGNDFKCPVPVVWGISATVKKFDKAMAKVEDRITRPNVTIDPKDVQASGLLKNALALEIPDEEGDFETTMVRDATISFDAISKRWASYCEQEDVENVVLPLLVIQIPNKAEGSKDSEQGQKAENELIHRVLETVRKHWPGMPEDCVAHVLGGRAMIEVGAYRIPKVAPQDIQHDEHVRVLVAKDAVSTGWDCPRAEVLVSLRPGKDHTYITQLLGRMVRTPLAQSTSDARLNSASCFLPRFDSETAKAVAEEIMGEREPSDSGDSGGVGPTIKVLQKPVELQNNPVVPDEVRAVIEELPSKAKPTALARPIKRLLKAAQAFAQDGLVPAANETAHEAMFDVLDGINAQHPELIEAETEQVLTATIRRITTERGAKPVVSDPLERAADAATVDDALRHLRRLISTSVVNKYLGREMKAAIAEATEHGEEPDINGVRARVAAMGLIGTPDGEPTVQQAVEGAADALCRLWLTTHTKKIAELPDSRKPTYEDIRGMARDPEPESIEVSAKELVDTVDADRKLLPTARLHVLSAADGKFPLDAKLNRWERAVIAQETKDGSPVVGWYRNPSAASNHSLRIPYQDGDSWKSVQPDFVFVAKVHGGLLPSIVDPHGAQLGDALPKLKALAQYADEHGDKFERIIAIGVEKGGILFGINLLNSKVRKAVYESAADTESIKAIFEKHGSKYGPVAD